MKTLSPRILFFRLGLLLALAPFFLLTAYNQPFFDDFRNAYWTRAHGTWGVQAWLFETWTGRFTSTFFMTVLNPVTYGWLGGVKLVAAVLIVVQWASIGHFLRALFHTALRVAFSWQDAFWCAALLLALFCNAAPAPFSFLYWFCGAVAYQIPLIGLLNFTALALRSGWGIPANRWQSAFLACGPLVLALAGNELTLVQALPILALLGYALPASSRPQWWLWLAIGAMAAALATVAPGNWVRARAMAPDDALQAYRWLVLLPRTAYSAMLFLARPLTALSLLAAVAMGLWLGYRQRAAGTASLRLAPRQWGAVLLAFGILNGIGFLLFRYLTVAAPLLRAQNEILLVMLISVAAVAWAAAQQLPEPHFWFPRRLRHSSLLILGLFGLSASGHVPEAWRELLTSAAPFDAQMQARFARLRSTSRAQEPTVTLPPLRLPYGHILIPLRQFSNFIEFDIDLTPGCEGNINGVMERYFEVPDVCCDTRAPALNKQK